MTSKYLGDLETVDAIDDGLDLLVWDRNITDKEDATKKAPYSTLRNAITSGQGIPIVFDIVPSIIPSNYQETFSLTVSVDNGVDDSVDTIRIDLGLGGKATQVHTGSFAKGTRTVAFSVSATEAAAVLVQYPAGVAVIPGQVVFLDGSTVRRTEYFDLRVKDIPETSSDGDGGDAITALFRRSLALSNYGYNTAGVGGFDRDSNEIFTVRLKSDDLKYGPYLNQFAGVDMVLRLGSSALTYTINSITEVSTGVYRIATSNRRGQNFSAPGNSPGASLTFASAISATKHEHPGPVITNVSTNQTLDAGSIGNGVRLTGANARTFTLPSGGGLGSEIVILNGSIAVLTINAPSGQLIEGGANITIPAGEAIRVARVTTTRWEIIADTRQSTSSSSTPTVKPRTTDYTITSDDEGDTILLTSNTRTFTLPAIGAGAGQVSAGYEVVIGNQGTGELTIRAASGNFVLAQSGQGAQRSQITRGQAFRYQVVDGITWLAIADTTFPELKDATYAAPSTITTGLFTQIIWNALAARDAWVSHSIENANNLHQILTGETTRARWLEFNVDVNETVSGVVYAHKKGAVGYALPGQTTFTHLFSLTDTKIKKAGTSAELATLLTQHIKESTDLFVYITAAFTNSGNNYSAGEFVSFAPESITPTVEFSISGGGESLSFQSKVELTSYRVTPNLLSGRNSADLQRNYQIVFENPSILPDAFYEVSAAGQTILTRRAWTTSTASVNFSISETIATAISDNINDTDNHFNVDVNWYDAASGGTLIGELKLTINIPPKNNRVLQAAVNAVANAGVTSITLPTNYADFTRLGVVVMATNNQRIMEMELHTAFLAAQSGVKNIVFGSRGNQAIITGSWNNSTRVLSASNDGRFIYAVLED